MSNIFKHYDETKKYLKKTDNGLWEFTSPHVLYLTTEQGKTYSSNKEDTDYNRFHDETVEIIDNNKQDILSYFDTDFTLVDLGPEYPDKTLPLMKEMHRQNRSLHYIPVDINPDYVQIAVNAAMPFAQKIYGMQSLFEECADKIPTESYSSRFVFIGLTFMNFDPDKIIQMMKIIAGQGGTIGIATELITDQNSIHDIISHYQNENVRQFALGPIKNLDIDHHKIEFDIRFDNHRVEVGFIFKSPAPHLGINIDDRMIVAVSHRYTINEFEYILKAAGSMSRLWLSKSGRTTFAISR
jgi:hypothetical protein